MCELVHRHHTHTYNSKESVQRIQIWNPKEQLNTMGGDRASRKVELKSEERPGEGCGPGKNILNQRRSSETSCSVRCQQVEAHCRGWVLCRITEDWHQGRLLGRGRGQSERTELRTAVPLWEEEDVGSKSRTLYQEVVRGRRKDGRGWTLNIACSMWESPPPPRHPVWDLRTTWVSGKTKRWRMHVRDRERWFLLSACKTGKEVLRSNKMITAAVTDPFPLVPS